jgi:hypothetical protein
MKRGAILVAVVWLNACSALLRPGAELHGVMTGTAPTATVAGERVDQPGVSFSPPSGRSWYFLGRSTELATLAARGSSNDETYVAAVRRYQLPSELSPEAFLTWVKAQRAAEPQAVRYELIHNDEQLYAERPEVCVKYRSTSKDYGAKRGGEFPFFDTLGMHCIHPTSKRVGVFVEFSRKAPTPADDSFNAEGLRLLQSVAFMPFK